MSSWRLGLALLFGLLSSATSPAFAHTPDTSYAIAKISEQELRIELRYDLESLSRIKALDSNRDGYIERNELRDAESDLRKFLRSHVALEVNEHAIDLGEFVPARWPEAETRVAQSDWNQTLVAFPFIRKTREIPESISLRFEFFGTLGDRHKVLGVFEQPDKPAYEVLYDSFEPDFLYFTEYAPSWSSQLGTFVVLGVEHILIGYDHMLFLLALLITSRFWQLVKIVSSFTIAHTLTLVLAATGVVTLPDRFVEVCIAATIVLVASENLLRKATGERWVLTFVFGLIHGFGFANVLRDLELPREGLTRCLLAFNVGVELGQLALVTAIWPLWMLVQRSKLADTISRLLSLAILCLGASWFFERLMGVEFMPF